MGLWEKGMGSQAWVHRYRTETLYASDQHKASLEDFCNSPSCYRVVKFVREPFRRTVSAYIHTLRYGHGDSSVASFFSAEADTPWRFSFRQFVQYLGTIDLRKGNIHHRVQTHPLERQLIPASMMVRFPVALGIGLRQAEIAFQFWKHFQGVIQVYQTHRGRN